MKAFTRAPLVALALAGWLLGSAPSRGGEGDDTVATEHRRFRIPFLVGEGQGRVGRVRLWVSRDRGMTWVLAGEAAPGQGAFRFDAPGDGLNWFASDVIGADGERSPARTGALAPDLKVRVAAAK